MGITGQWSAIWDSNTYPQSVPGYVTGWPVQTYPVFRPRPQRVLLRPPSELLRGYHLLLPERRKVKKAGQRALRCLLGRNPVLRTRRIRHYKVQVKMGLRMFCFYTNQAFSLVFENRKGDFFSWILDNVTQSTQLSPPEVASTEIRVLLTDLLFVCPQNPLQNWSSRQFRL